MSERYFVIELDDNAAIHVWFSYHRGRVTAFAVKLLYHAALSMAIMELKAEYQLYIERYLKWLAEEKQRSKG